MGNNCCILFIIFTLMNSVEALVQQRSTYYKVDTAKDEFVWEPIGTLNSDSELRCVSACSVTDECISAHFSSSSSKCFLLKPQNVCSTEWALSGYTPMFRKHGVTQLTVDVFRASSGTGVSVYDPWVSESYQSPCTPAVYNMTQKIDFTFKHPLMNSWGTLNIQEVHLTLWKEGTEVVKLVFDGRNSTAINWFSHDKIRESSFADLIGYTSAFVSLPGWGDVRRFYLMHTHSGCNNDWGWMCFVERDRICDWEKHPPYPAFIYSTSGLSAHWEEDPSLPHVGLADDVLISLRMEV